MKKFATPPRSAKSSQVAHREDRTARRRADQLLRAVRVEGRSEHDVAFRQRPLEIRSPNRQRVPFDSLVRRELNESVGHQLVAG